MSSPTTIDNTAEALERLTDAFKGRSVVEGIVKAFVASLELIEASSFEVLAQRILSAATGPSLTGLGLLVGEDRQGRTDEELRAAIRLRIRVNSSSGRTKDMLDILALMVATEKNYHETDLPASFHIEVYQPESLYSYRTLLSQARPRGVRASMEYTTGNPSGYMRLGSTYGAAGGGTLGSTTTGAVGEPIGGAFQI